MTRLPSSTNRLTALTTAALLLTVACSDGGDAGAGTTVSENVPAPRLDPAQNRAPSGPGLLADRRPVTREEVEAIGFTWGSEEALVRVIEFSDFGCGVCRQFHEETFYPLMEEFVESGQVLWRFVPFNVGMFPNADGALDTGLCAGEQGKVLEVGDALFASQREWKAPGDVSAVFERAAAASGLDMEAWSECIESGRLEPVAARHTNIALRLAVRGTPTFFVEGYPVQGALPLETFRELLRSVVSDLSAPTASPPTPGGS